MALDPTRSARWATILFATQAYVACEIASHLDGIPDRFGVGFGLGVFGLTILGSYFLPSPKTDSEKPPLWLTFVLVAALALPIAIEPVLREITNTGQPLEMQLVNGLRVLGMGLAAAASWRVYRRLSAIVSLFLALFASAMGDQPAIPYALTVLAACGGLWLVFAYRAESASISATTNILEQAFKVRLQFPVRELILFGLLAAVGLAITLAGPKEVIGTLGELVPTSGGTGEQDPFARHGTNDGPEETAGLEANSVGMVESDLFIESREDSLLDVVGDLYGPPHKPRESDERLVAAGQERVKENHKKLPENRRANRQFDTSRRGPKDARQGQVRGPRGVFEVEGRTPLHIAAVAYDLYDVEKKYWLQAPALKGRFIDEESDGGDWMLTVKRREHGDWYAKDDRHEIKIADLKDRLVPTPAMTTRFKIRKVTRADAYELDYDGILGLAGRTKTPSGVIVHTQCRTLDPRNLPEEAFAVPSFQPNLFAVPAELKSEMARYAEEWTRSIPRGWPQIDAIGSRLRTEYVCDPKAVPPKEHPSPVLWFLNESKSGPDYLFATAATLMLRTLNYPTRVCLGYYASPEAYDPVSQHTTVKSTDLHTWPEILLRDGHWLVIEPTPGYETLPPRKSFADRLQEAASDLGRWIVRNAIELLAGALAVLLLAWKRKTILDRSFTLVWMLKPGRTWSSVVLKTTKLLERRGRLAGNSRREFETLAQWARTVCEPALHMESMPKVVELAEWAAYAAQLHPPLPESEIREICRRAIGRSSWRDFRKSDVTGGAA